MTIAQIDHRLEEWRKIHPKEIAIRAGEAIRLLDELRSLKQFRADAMEVILRARQSAEHFGGAEEMKAMDELIERLRKLGTAQNGQ